MPTGHPIAEWLGCVTHGPQWSEQWVPGQSHQTGKALWSQQELGLKPRTYCQVSSICQRQSEEKT